MSRQDLTSSNHQKATFGELSTLAQVRKFALNLQGFHKVTLQVVSRNHPQFPLPGTGTPKFLSLLPIYISKYTVIP